MQSIKINDKEIYLILAKNPTGFNQSVYSVLEDDSEKDILICINDRKKAVRHIENSFKKSITDITLDELGLSMRAYNAFRRANINTIAELIDYYYENKTFNSLKSFGKNTIQEVTDKFKELGLNIEKGALTVL